MDKSAGYWLLGILFMALGSPADAQDWFSESSTDSVLIQNSFPKGGPYKGLSFEHHRPSYVVFVSRITNGRDVPIELRMEFSADPIPIPDSPGTFVKLFLPEGTMDPNEWSSLSYGVTELQSLHHETSLEQIIPAGKEYLIRVAAFFYQTEHGAWNQERGGNRAELILKGGELFYHMPPHIEYLRCGTLVTEQ